MPFQRLLCRASGRSVVEGKVPFRSPPGEGRSWGWGSREGPGWGSSAWKRSGYRGLGGCGSQAKGVPGQPPEARGTFRPESEASPLPLFLPCTPRPTQEVRAQAGPGLGLLGVLRASPSSSCPWLCARGAQRQVQTIQALPKGGTGEQGADFA